MTSRGRYLTHAEFGRLLGDLHITENVFQDRLLEFLEEQRILLPAARARWPEDLIVEQNDGIPTNRSPEAVRLAAVELGKRIQNYNGWKIDPKANHPYDEPSSAPFITHEVAATPFLPWKSFKLSVVSPSLGQHLVDGAVDTYYHDWQALLVADAMDIGVRFLIDMSADRTTEIWAKNDRAAIAGLPAFVTRSVQSERGLRDGKKWAKAFDAAARAQIVQDRAHADISVRHSGPSRYFNSAEMQEINERSHEAAKAEIVRGALDENILYAFITYLCERWDEWSRRDRQVIAGEYKRHINRALGLLIHGLGKQYPDIVKRLGRVTGHFANTLEEIFPDTLKDRREKLRLSLQHSVVKRAPTSDPDFTLTDAEVTDLLDWTERNRFLKLHVSIDTILAAQFRGTALDHTSLAKEVESLSATFEHMTNALLLEAGQHPNGTLKPKLTALWDNDTVVKGILQSQWNYTQTNPPATLASQLSLLAAYNPGPRGEVAKIVLTAVLYRNAGLHSGMGSLNENELHEATYVFLLAMMYLRKSFLNATIVAPTVPASTT